MILFIDETESEQYFIVAGLPAESAVGINNAYKHFRKGIADYPLNRHLKERIFTEYKSTLIDRQFPKIKIRMLKEVRELEGYIFYSCYNKRHISMKQHIKESVYITLFSNILNNIIGPVDIIFDSFNKRDFEQKIAGAFKDHENVQSIGPRDSQSQAGHLWFLFIYQKYDPSGLTNGS